MIRRKCFVPVRYQLPKGKLAVLDFEYLYMIHRVGRNLPSGSYYLIAAGQPTNCNCYNTFLITNKQMYALSTALGG